jgi:hypothetical protein
VRQGCFFRVLLSVTKELVRIIGILQGIQQTDFDRVSCQDQISVPQGCNSKPVRAVFGDWFFTKKTAAENFCTNAFELKKVLRHFGANSTGTFKASVNHNKNFGIAQPERLVKRQRNCPAQGLFGRMSASTHGLICLSIHLRCPPHIIRLLLLLRRCIAASAWCRLLRCCAGFLHLHACTSIALPWASSATLSCSDCVRFGWSSDRQLASGWKIFDPMRENLPSPGKGLCFRHKQLVAIEVGLEARSSEPKACRTHSCQKE